MKITVDVTQDELAEMNLDTPEELKERLLEQLDDGVTGDAGEAGQDWMVSYQIEVRLI